MFYLSETTSDLVNNNSITISNTIKTHKYFNIKYFTRLQKKFWSKSTLFWPINLNTKNFYINHIIKLMKSQIKYIDRYSSFREKYGSINIKINNNGIYIIGYTINLYNFIKNKNNKKILESIWIDNFNRIVNGNLVLSRYNFNKNIEILKPTKILNTKCCICTKRLSNNICKLHCNHKYHINCIKKWMTEYNSKCPLCRKNV